MKNYKSLFLLFALTAFAFSCQKHVIEYDTTPVEGMAEFELHYFVPVTAGAANNITKVELNGVWINQSATLSTYNAIPSGAVGRFYVTKPGKNNIKMYKGDAMELVYDQDVDLQPGKQNVFVYDFNAPPKVIDTGYPFIPEVTESTGTTAWIRFYNFLFEKAGEPTPLKLQYQYQYTVDNDTKEKSDWINVGNPVSFGEATDWVPVHVNKTVELSSSYARLDYRILTIDNSGNPTGQLQVLNSSGKMVDYSDWWNAYVGRRYMHILGGMRLDKPLSGVRQFTAL